MSAVETIGVDLGGTKILIGVLDAERTSSGRARERSTGQQESELFGPARAGGREALEARPEAAAVGPRHPGDDRPARRGTAIAAVNLPIEDLPIRDLIARAGRSCRSSSTTTPTWRCSPSTSTEPPGAAENAVMITVGTGIGGGLVIGGELYRGTTGAAAPSWATS